MKKYLLSMLLALLVPLGAVAQEAYAVFSGGTLTFYYDNQKSSRSGTKYALNEGSNNPGWYSNKYSITKVIFDDSFADARPTTTYNWFVECTNLTKIEGIRNLNTVDVTNMSGMFYHCKSLTSLDVSSFNTSNVTNMSAMFGACDGLTSLDLGNFNTENVTEMYAMFYSSSGLTSLDVRSFNTTKITDMSGMFAGCSSLISINLSSFDTSNVTNMGKNNAYGGMFTGCTSLTTIYCSENWTTDKVTSSYQMFSNCTNLVGGAGTTFSSYTDCTYAHIDGGTSNPGYLTLWSESTKEVYAIYNNGILTFYYDNKSSRIGTKYTMNTGSNNPGWYNNRAGITKVVFDASFAGARPTTTYSWFNGCSKLVEVEGINNLKTDNVTNMRDMFNNCSSLTSLDVSGFDTGNVTSMYQMFNGCSRLATLDVSGFDTGNVTSMYQMFNGCSGLTTLDVSGFNTSSVTSMYQMFNGCSGLKSLNVSGFDTGNVTDLQCVFQNCSSLTSLDVSGFNTGKVKYMSGLFYGCSGLASLDLSSFNTGIVTNMSGMFQGCSSLVTIYCGYEWSISQVTNDANMFQGCSNIVGGAGTVFNSNYIGKEYAHMDGGTSNPGYLTLKGSSSAAAEVYVILYRGILTFYYDNMKSLRYGTVYSLNTVGTSPNWYANRTSITKVVFDPSFADARPTTTGSWFKGAINLTTVEGIGNLNTSDVTDMSYMFYDCGRLTNLDVSGFGTGNVTDMQSMFHSCSGLTSLDVGGFDTGDVTSAYNMFYGCSGLTGLDVSSFDTGKMTSMNGMFQGCSGLTSLDVSNFNTSNVTGMVSMFQGCSALTSLDVSGFDTGSVTGMRSMFQGCSGLTSLDLSGFDTGSVTIMQNMFNGCSGLSSLDLSSFDTGNVTNMSQMFYDDSSLVTIYCGYGWSTVKVSNTTSSNGSGMFQNCCSLVGGAGTVYNSSYTGKEYAHVDGGISNPGYLTLKAASTGLSINLIDNTDLLEDHNGETNNVTLEFDIDSGKWITLCLPFDATEEQTRDALGDDVDIEELSSSTYDEDTKFLMLNFSPSSSITAGKPYVIKVSETKSHPTFSGVTIDNSAPTTVSTTFCSMTGIYNATPLTAGDKNTLFIQNNQFYYPSTTASLPATKCYFTLSLSASEARGIGMRFWDDNEDVLSGIYETTAATTADGDAWYTPQGVRMNRPRKGLFIHNGKKVFVGNK